MPKMDFYPRYTRASLSLNDMLNSTDAVTVCHTRVFHEALDVMYDYSQDLFTGFSTPVKKIFVGQRCDAIPMGTFNGILPDFLIRARQREHCFAEQYIQSFGNVGVLIPSVQSTFGRLTFEDVEAYVSDMYDREVSKARCKMTIDEFCDRVNRMYGYLVRVWPEDLDTNDAQFIGDYALALCKMVCRNPQDVDSSGEEMITIDPEETGRPLDTGISQLSFLSINNFVAKIHKNLKSRVPFINIYNKAVLMIQYLIDNSTNNFVTDPAKELLQVLRYIKEEAQDRMYEPSSEVIDKLPKYDTDLLTGVSFPAIQAFVSPLHKKLVIERNEKDKVTLVDLRRIVEKETAQILKRFAA